jgi:hypothetical protein
METSKYHFVPPVGPPTVKKLQKVTLLFLGVITIGCSAVLLFSRNVDLLFIILIYIILCLFIIAARFSTKYIVEIRIDPIEGMLYSTFINHKGEISITKINIKEARYSYKLRTTRGYVGYILTIKDRESRLQIYETKSKNKDLTNVFSRDQLDDMNQIILQIRGQYA